VILEAEGGGASEYCPAWKARIRSATVPSCGLPKVSRVKDQMPSGDDHTLVRYSYCEMGGNDYLDAAPMVDLGELRSEGLLTA
jgi:hypothetical protein